MDLKIALDIDDVLAGFVPQIHKYFGQELTPHNHWSHQENTGKLIIGSSKPFAYTDDYYHDCHLEPSFWISMQAVSLPCDIHFPVACYITSSPESMLRIRSRWLEENGFPKAPVIHSRDKASAMKRYGIDILVDDKLKTINEVNTHQELCGIHFTPWYSTQKDPNGSIKNLSEVLEFYSKM